MKIKNENDIIEICHSLQCKAAAPPFLTVSAIYFVFIIWRLIIYHAIMYLILNFYYNLTRLLTMIVALSDCISQLLTLRNNIKSLYESFSTFFMDKIEKIRMNFTNDVQNMPDIKSSTVKSRMTCFELATADEVRKLILNSLSKTCDLDPIPTELLKSCLDVLLVPITQMVNLSLISGVFPIISNMHY